MWQLHNFDPDQFLAEYWQRKPLLIRQMLPGFSSVISPEELGGLSCEPGVHSRLVVEKDAETPWKLSYGPFDEETLTSLPETHYSLLVSECEKWIPELRGLVDCFDFIPKWRLDDLMISYAPDQGSVGPHIDDYDVFLIQARGQRRWSIETSLRDNPEVFEGMDLAILKEFNADEEWIMEPGDVLYLPPNIPHHGVALGDGCMNYSVGFRANAIADIMDSFLLEASDAGMLDLRYRDVPLTRERDSAEIRTEEILEFKAMIHRMLDGSSSVWPDVVGKLVSDATLAEDLPGLDCDSLEQATEYEWEKHPDSKFFFHRHDGQIRFYHNGNVTQLADTPENLGWCQILCHAPVIELEQAVAELPDDTATMTLQLIKSFALIPLRDDADDDG
jgi:50S ribosomal protein L16 3-hydroxylase